MQRTEVIAFAPGRVNLIGEHTDYNEGLALPFAIQTGVTVHARAIDADRIEATALDLGEEDSFELSHPEPGEGWRAFVRGAVGELRRSGARLSGAVLEISGTVPRGSGLASSAALEVALVLALLAIAGETEPVAGQTASRAVELAKLCARIEHEWVGAQTGLLDQLTSLGARAGHALRIDFRSLELRPVPVRLGGHRLVVLDSGEQHANAASGYNERRAECARACQLLGIASLRDASFEQARSLPDPLDRRVLHVLGSNQRVDSAVAALEVGNLMRLGALLDESHASLRELYEISTEAVERAVARLKAAGALGARIMGGGFGGYVLGLMAPDAHLPAGAVEVAPGPGARMITPPA